ncbi:MAG: 4'-phosphopantetheinyl transferase superfamily protein [Myxococcota bacterium]
MLGNDVVDLADVDARPETFRRRFDERVFTEEERRALADDPSPHPLRWAHWAAKEAAYKCLRQGDPRFVFSPIRLEARFEPAERASSSALFPFAASGAAWTRRGALRVVDDERLLERAASRPGPVELELRAFATPELVHVVAQPAGRDGSDVTLAVETLADSVEEASLAVRRLARREAARLLAVQPARVTIGRRGRIPILELDGVERPVALSLSHHGRFIACALAPCRATRDGGARGATKPVLTVGSVGNPTSGRDAKRRAG